MQNADNQLDKSELAASTTIDSISQSAAPPPEQENDLSEEIPDSFLPTDLVNVSKISPDFELDMRYATTNNFMKTAVYPCAECLLRYEVALALRRANYKFQKQGYHIKLFDCYRPLSVQKQMWKIYPNPNYVANPYKKMASIHNRGGAVDLTLVDSTGVEVDMGTGFDFFGKKAHHTYTALPTQVLAMRKLLKETMESVGFQSIRTEWWHYSYKKSMQYETLDIPLPCSP